MPNTITPVNPELLKAQIEGISHFASELTQGASAKKMMADINAKSRDLYQVKPGDITVLEGFNPRVKNQEYFDGIEALSQDIERLGYMQDKPLAGYIAKVDGKDTIVLQDGHRRYAAVLRAIARGAKIAALPLVLKDRSQNMLDLTLGLLHSNEGQPFNTYEKAIIAKRLKGFGWENKAIAVEMRCTTAFVGQLLTMAGAPEAIQELVRTGQMSATHAIDLVKEHGENSVAVAKARVATAKSAGKQTTTAKDDKAKAKQRRAKGLGFDFYTAVCSLFDDKATMKVIDKEIYAVLDSLIFRVENQKEPKVKAVKVAKVKAIKVPKVPKVPKVKAIKVPLAKKVAAASRPRKAAASGASAHA